MGAPLALVNMNIKACMLFRGSVPRKRYREFRYRYKCTYHVQAYRMLQTPNFP